MTPLKPGSIIGVLGGGQLGRMLALAAAPLGYRVHVYAPEDDPCAGDVAWRVTRGDYDDTAALAAFAASVDVITFEFENVPVAPLTALGSTGVFPPRRALEIGQDRIAEKRFAEGLGGTPAVWAEVANRAALAAAIVAIGTPSILKLQRLGYDGKGQARVMSAADADEAWEALGCQPSVLEAMVPFFCEFSVIAVRGQDGEMAYYESPENVHKDGILDTSTVPARAALADQITQARALAQKVAVALDYVGVFAIEFFAAADGPVFNEIAPRVHNSGHWTIEGAETSQFENHIRAICGLPLGPTATTARQIVMTNLIGDDVLGTSHILAEGGAHLHLYGKNEPKSGRKMGHVTRVVR